MGPDRHLEQLTEFAQSVPSKGLSNRHVERLGLHVLDALGCAVRAVDEPPVRAAIRASDAVPAGPGCATALAAVGPTTPEQAAFVNGVAIRCLDFNDTLSARRTGGHPSDALAAVLASCEAEGRPGSALAKGLLAAYATFAAIADELPLRDLGFDQGLLIGLATAVGVSVATDMSAETTRHAVALTAMTALSPRASRSGQLSHWKGAATAFAAREALTTCRLARAGMTGPPQPFVGRHGIWEVLGAEPAEDLALDLSAIERVGLKLLPVEWCAQAPVESVLEDRHELVAERVAEIRVEAYGFLVDEIGGGRGDHDAKWGPTTRETADHSLPFLLAVAICRGEVSLRTYEERLWEDPEVRALMERISIVEDPALTRAYPGSQAALIRFTFSDGRVVERTTREARGHPARPATSEEVLAKFHELASDGLPPDPREVLAERACQLAELEDVASLLQPLRALARAGESHA